MGRFITLLLLGMISYFSIKSRLKSMVKPKPQTPAPEPPFDPGAADEMAQDPVCGTFVDPATSVSIIHQGKPIHFCGEPCREAFLKTQRGE